MTRVTSCEIRIFGIYWVTSLQRTFTVEHFIVDLENNAHKIDFLIGLYTHCKLPLESFLLT